MKDEPWNDPGTMNDEPWNDERKKKKIGR